MLKLKDLYNHKPSGRGVMIEGRGLMNEWKGSFQPMVFHLKKMEVRFLGYVQVMDPYLGPVQARKFAIEVESCLDQSKRITELPQRSGGIAFWHDSYVEQIRKGKRIELYISRTRIYSELKDMALVDRVIYLNCLLLYYEGILHDGDFSFEQFTKDLRSKEGSSTAFDNFEKNRDVLNAPNIQSIYNREVQDEKSELVWLINHIKLAIQGNYDFELMAPDYTINALRQRPVKVKWYEVAYDICKGEFELYRSRCAGGIHRQSRLSWPIYHTKAKRIIMSRIIKYLENSFNLEISSMEVDSVQFYITAFENSINCFDMINAEKTLGCVFYHILPGIIDFSSEQDFSNEFAPALQSGVDITRLINLFGIVNLIKVLRSKGLLPKEKFKVWQGGDNFGGRLGQLAPPVQEKEESEERYLERLIDVDSGLWHIIEPDHRILGFSPKAGRFFGNHQSIDGVDSMIAWNIGKRSFRMIQTRQSFSRIADNVIQYDWFKEGDCLKFLKWVMSRDFDLTETYNHDDLWKVVGPSLFSEVNGTTEFDKMFPGCREWIQSLDMIIDNNVQGRYVAESDLTLIWV